MTHQLFIHTTISAQDAIRAGSTVAGDISIPLTESDVALVREHWDEAAPYVGGPAANDTKYIAVTEPGIAGAIEALKQHAADRAAYDAAVAAARDAMTAQKLTELAAPDVTREICVGLLPDGTVTRDKYRVTAVATRITVSVRPTVSSSGEYVSIEPPQWFAHRVASTYVSPHDKALLAIKESEAENARRLDSAAEAARPELQRMLAEKIAEEATEAQKKQDELKALEVALSTMSPHVLERWKAGRLPESELKDALANVAFAVLNLPPYERLQDGDIEHSDECDDQSDTKVRTREYDGELDAEEWESWKTAKAAIEAAGFEAELRKAEIYCATCCESHTRLQARATTTIGGIDVRRSYAIG